MKWGEGRGLHSPQHILDELQQFDGSSMPPTASYVYRLNWPISELRPHNSQLCYNIVSAHGHQQLVDNSSIRRYKLLECSVSLCPVPFCSSRAHKKHRKAPPAPKPGAKPKPAPPPKKNMVKAVYDYDAVDAEELSFTEGTMLELISEGTIDDTRFLEGL